MGEREVGRELVVYCKVWEFLFFNLFCFIFLALCSEREMAQKRTHYYYCCYCCNCRLNVTSGITQCCSVMSCVSSGVCGVCTVVPHPPVWVVTGWATTQSAARVTASWAVRCAVATTGRRSWSSSVCTATGWLRLASSLLTDSWRLATLRLTDKL